MAMRDGGDSGSDSGSGAEPVSDIFISPDIPIEEIAVEVQKSWKLRDRHVESLVQRVSPVSGMHV